MGQHSEYIIYKLFGDRERERERFADDGREVTFAKQVDTLPPLSFSGLSE
jgi:hypothetical protein